MEKDIERKLADKIKMMGGLCLKFVSPGCAGVPDRIVLMPGGHIWFVELKDHALPRELQKYWLDLLGRMGFPALVVDSDDAAEQFLHRIAREVGDEV